MIFVQRMSMLAEHGRYTNFVYFILLSVDRCTRFGMENGCIFMISVVI